ncbi:MAG: Fe-S cluster assembly protein SufD [Anaerolineales bacterium]|nr:Fe-S cluster assembly protein SufD [Anaerolineales bacterium]
MATPVIVTKKRRETEIDTHRFPFTENDLPGFDHPNDIPEFLREYRLRGWNLFQTIPMPTINDEAWRRTDLRGLRASELTLHADAPKKSFRPPRNLLKPLVGKRHGGQIIIVPSREPTVQVDDEWQNRGIIFTDFRNASYKNADFLANAMGQIVRPEEGKFAALATAFADDGVVVYIPRGVRLIEPLHSVIWSPGVRLARFTRLLVWVDDDAELTLVHEVASPNQSEGQSFHAGVVEIHVGKGSHLTFVEMQSWGNDVWNFTHERARVERDGTLDWIFGSVGSQLTKTFMEIDLIGEGSTGKMSGFYFTNGSQHLDHDTQQNHFAPHTTSDLLFKGALQDRSRSVWQGMIYVAPGAQKTDGYQANRNLTLSSQARADSIPGLEIMADDVRCTHGATVGKIDEEQLFYLLSRGIPRNEAIRLIVEGFFEPIMERVPYGGVRQRFRSAIKQKIG